MIVALLLTARSGNECPRLVAIVIALAAGVAIGVFQGSIITKIGIPSFVVTLAGLLGWNGVVLLLIGRRAVILIQNDFVIGFGEQLLRDAGSAGSSR